MNTLLHPIRPALRAGILSAALLAALPLAAVAAKTDAPVQVSAATSGTLRVGQPLTVTLTFRTAKGGQALAAHYTTEGALVLQSPADVALNSDTKGQATASVTLTPTGDGEHFLNVFATVDGRTRAVSVPLAIGSTDARKSAQQTRSAAPARGGFVELKAVETVR